MERQSSAVISTDQKELLLADLDDNENETTTSAEATLEETTDLSTTIDCARKEQSGSSKQNTMDISNVALASLRHHTGLREAAEIATAAFIDAGVVTQADTSLIIDHNKLKRAQEKLVKEFDEEFKEKIKKEGISCILFDGRVDETRVLLKCDNSDQQFPGLIREEHYSVCQEPGGSYLFHFTPEDSSCGRKHAEIIADQVIDWLVKHDVVDSLKAIGGDSTAVNTGHAGDAMKHIEIKTRKKISVDCL